MKQVDPKIVVPAGQFSDVIDQVPGALKIATSIAWSSAFSLPQSASLSTGLQRNSCAMLRQVYRPFVTAFLKSLPNNGTGDNYCVTFRTTLVENGVEKFGTRAIKFR
jgi:hypothetical protein